MLFFTYILYSPSLDKYYVGSTDDLQRRLEEHNRGKGNFTRKGIPWDLVYREEFNNRPAAVSREMSIKKRKSRRYIEQLVSQQSEHPVL